MALYTLPKTERIYLRDAINRLFTDGKGLSVFPYRIVYLILPADDPSQTAPVSIMTIAPKKRFKHAVDRNRVKRLTREAYRIAKIPLHECARANGCKLAVAFLYADNRHLSFTETQQRMSRIIHILTEKLNHHSHTATKG